MTPSISYLLLMGKVKATPEMLNAMQKHLDADIFFPTEKTIIQWN